MCKDCGDENHIEWESFAVVDKDSFDKTMTKAQNIKDLIAGQDWFSQKEKKELNELIDGLAGGNFWL